MIVITTSIETKVLSKENLFIKEFTGIFRLENIFFFFLIIENIISKIKTAFLLLLLIS